MSTLANTSWTIKLGGGSITVAFSADGAITETGANGQSFQGSWAEASDGHFMFQTPKSTNNPDINQVFFGMHEDGEGNGHYCTTSAVLSNFTMAMN